MKYSTKLSDTVHVMVLIAINQEKSLSSASIAESVHTNPGFVRQLMLKLKKAELMTSVAGHARPSLSKPADQITLLDIYKAVEGDKPLLHLDTHTNPDCGVGINIQLSLQGFYNELGGEIIEDCRGAVYASGELLLHTVVEITFGHLTRAADFGNIAHFFRSRNGINGEPLVCGINRIYYLFAYTWWISAGLSLIHI